MWFSMAHLIMVAFIFSGCNFFFIHHAWFSGCFIFSLNYSRITVALEFAASLSWCSDIDIYWLFDLEVKLIILSICLWFFSSWNLKFVSDYQSICVSYCNCGFNDSNWSNNILVILTTVLVTVDAVQKYFVTSVD